MTSQDMLDARRVLLSVVGIRTIARMIRRRSEAASGGPPLTRGERLEQRGALLVVLAPVLVLVSVIMPPAGSSLLTYGGILTGVAGLALFFASGAVESVPDQRPPAPKAPVGRNDPCPCGSGEKYKRCHGAA